MYYELTLISVLLGAGYWGAHFVRIAPARLYGAMLIGAAALSAAGLYARRVEDAAPVLGVLGAIGVGAGACLLVLGPLARAFARRAAGADRLALAARLLELADLLAPGSGVGEEKVLLGAMRDIRDGKIDHTLDALTSAKQRANGEERRAIDERIAMLYLSAYRWDDAIAHAEQNLMNAIPPASAPSEPDAPGGNPAFALRRALGVAPPVWIELLSAYAYKGDLEQAARMLARLEDVCERRADAAVWLHRARLVFLALAGRVTAVAKYVAPKRSRHMSAAARTYWMAVALERHGDGAAAKAAYEKARSRSRGRPRILIDQALARLPTAHEVELGAAATALLARVESSALPEVQLAGRPRSPHATHALIVAVAGAAAAIAMLLGDSTDVGVLVRGGALVRGMVDAGQWWRLVSTIYVHVGDGHLVLNVLALWMIGRLAEAFYGPSRTVALFGVAGVVGALASYLTASAGVSAGASGGIFGLLGAVFVELTLHRARHRTAWRRGIWGSLLTVAVAQVGLDFLYPGVDQWAHGAGLAAGAFAGALLSPFAPWPKWSLWIGRALALAFAAASIAAGVFVVRTPLAASLGAAPIEIKKFAPGVSVAAPANWKTATGQLYDPDSIVVMTVVVSPRELPLASQVEDWTATEPERARQQHFDDVSVATQHVVPLPDGWQGSELVMSMPQPEPIGGRQRFHVVTAGTEQNGRVVLVSIYMPESVAHAAPELIRSLLGSLRLVY